MHPQKHPEVTSNSRGNQGFQVPPEKDLESPSSMSLEARFPYYDSSAMTRFPLPRAWRSDYPGATREAP